jgi:glutathione S-transferase
VYRLFEFPRSGNCYKLRLLLTQLDEAFEAVTIDILGGESRTASFLEMNPAGKVPVLEVAPGDWLPESNAALWYLAEGTSFLPGSRRGRAEVLRWLFFEQYSHEPNVAVARFWVRFLGRPPELEERLARRIDGAHSALRVMEAHLGRHTFLVDDRYGIADIALYAYTHVADEGGIELTAYPAIRAWLARVAEQPLHVAMNG